MVASTAVNQQHHDLTACVQLDVICFEVCTGCDRDLDKQEAEIKEKLKQEKKREERKNREAFSDLLREDLDEGFIKPKMRWRVCRLLGLDYTWVASTLLRIDCVAVSFPVAR